MRCCGKTLSVGIVALVLGAWCAPVRADEKPYDPAAGTAEVKGTVKLTGEAPKRKPLDMGSEPKCGEMHPEAPTSETVIVNNGAIKNAFVYVKKGLEAWKFTAPKDPVVLDQKGCMYSPHVLGVMVGQPVQIKNSDELAHNVHGMPKQNSEFNYGQSKAGVSNDQVFTEPEVLVKLKCDIHGWMNCYIGVVAHPLFAVTGDDGSFVIKGLPPGEYEIEVVHEKLGKSSQKVTVGDKESKQVDFAFEGK